MTTIHEIRRSVSDVLTTADELMEDGDSEQVGAMLASFLKTLLADLDKLSSTNVERTVRRAHRRPAFEDNNPNRTPPKKKGERPIIPNKYDGTCSKCGAKVDAMQGYVTTNPSWTPSSQKGKGPKKWLTYCPGHIPA